MRIQLKFFAIARESAGVAQADLDLPANATVAAAAEEIARQFPALQPHLPRMGYAVNLVYAQAQTVLNDGDELALIPAVSGGAS